LKTIAVRISVKAADSFINPPEVAIPGAGRPAPGEGGLTWRTSMTLSLAVGHRGVDGAPAARFLAAVAERLQVRERCCASRGKT
jgi:pyruvate/2-oxoglutarate dehydrogenase complex dihydrolipoamide acyltransferase (E2) component